ncbi:MAG: hypothetical protein ABSG33_10585 [Candidatus Bathyarchaeia archaeon]
MITPDRFLLLAKRMVSNPGIPEEEARSAISRAYYSLYHETLQLVIKKYSLDLIREIERQYGRQLTIQERAKLNSLDPDFLCRINFHRILPVVMRNMQKPIIASKFMNFREKRNQADYDLKLTTAQSDAITIVTNIDKFVVVVKTM